MTKIRRLLMTATFIVERAKLTNAHWMHTEPAALTEGAVRLRVDAFALTSNNITYAAFGDAMNYWGFFPTGEQGWGIVPVWGFATVVQSLHPGVAVGEKLSGYWPMYNQAVLQ